MSFTIRFLLNYNIVFNSPLADLRDEHLRPHEDDGTEPQSNVVVGSGSTSRRYGALFCYLAIMVFIAFLACLTWYVTATHQLPTSSNTLPLTALTVRFRICSLTFSPLTG